VRDIKEGRAYLTDVESEGLQDHYPNMDDEELVDFVTEELDEQWVALGHPQKELDTIKSQLQDRVWRTLWIRYFRLGKHKMAH